MDIHTSCEQKLVIATRNEGKRREFEQMLRPLGFQVLSLVDFPDISDIAETGTTFAENAHIKARATADALGFAVIADDSGLAVQKLNGAPGVYSARYAGEDATDEANIRKLLSELKRLKAHEQPVSEVTVRTGGKRKLLSEAAFICSIVYLNPLEDGGVDTITVEGRLEGGIVDEPSGDGGFGYDPVFYVSKYEATMAELTSDQKNAVSHRGQALQKLLHKLRSKR